MHSKQDKDNKNVILIFSTQKVNDNKIFLSFILYNCNSSVKQDFRFLKLVNYTTLVLSR